MCKGNKSITCWGVTTNEAPLKILTIVSSKDEALEYIENLIRLSYMDEYKTWCYFNHIDNIKDYNNWRLYVQKRLSVKDFTKYSIVRCKFNAKGISLAMRVLNSCIPIGSSFDDKLEYENLIKLASVNDDVKMIVNNISESASINPNIMEDYVEMLIKNDKQ